MGARPVNKTKPVPYSTKIKSEPGTKTQGSESNPNPKPRKKRIKRRAYFYAPNGYTGSKRQRMGLEPPKEVDLNPNFANAQNWYKPIFEVRNSQMLKREPEVKIEPHAIEKAKEPKDLSSREHEALEALLDLKSTRDPNPVKIERFSG